MIGQTIMTSPWVVKCHSHQNSSSLIYAEWTKNLKWHTAIGECKQDRLEFKPYKFLQKKKKKKELKLYNINITYLLCYYWAESSQARKVRKIYINP